MRKMILIGAMVLVSATAAVANDTRSLSLSSSDTAAAPRPTYVRQAGEVTVTPAPVPTAAAPLPAVQPLAPAAPTAATSTAPAAVAAAPQPVATDPAPTAQTTGSVQKPSRSSRSARAKPRGKSWTEARIVRELHRHGIYW